MQPCGGEEEAAGGGGMLPPSSSGGLMLFYELGVPGEAEAEAEAGEEAEAAGGESPEELEEEEEATATAASSGETVAAAAAGGSVSKSCTYQGCSQTTTQAVKQRKPWMCKCHRNKIYKDKYKLKKSDQSLGGGRAAAAGAGPRAEDSVEGSVSVTKQRRRSIGARPARPTLLEQVLNKKETVPTQKYSIPQGETQKGRGVHCLVGLGGEQLYSFLVFALSLLLLVVAAVVCVIP
uniref:Regulatory factor X-associated protein RFXANK-binding domain-containing protein n=1 Tax=Amazona collaria TaxID=241587 RepID=A0A8B9G4U4_9PSIT